MAELPNASYYRYQYRITLHETEYLLKFHYADGLGRWVLSIYDHDDTAELVAGIAVVYGLNLLTLHQDVLEGSLTITPIDGTKSHPTYEDLAQDLERLVYVEP